MSESDSTSLAESFSLVLDVEGRPPDRRVQRRPLGNRPADQNATDLKAEVIVQSPGAMSLHHKLCQRVAAAPWSPFSPEGTTSRPAGGLLGLGEVAFARYGASWSRGAPRERGLTTVSGTPSADTFTVYSGATTHGRHDAFRAPLPVPGLAFFGRAFFAGAFLVAVLVVLSLAALFPPDAPLATSLSRA